MEKLFSRLEKWILKNVPDMKMNVYFRKSKWDKTQTNRREYENVWHPIINI